jgi:hypothetical protein
LSDNRLAMKQHVLLFAAALAAAAAAGCEKSSDLAPVTAETQGIVASYQQRATELERRVNDLVRRGTAINASPGEPASFLLTNSRADLEGMKAMLRDAPARIAKTAGDDKLEEPKKVAELRLLKHQLQDQLGDSWVRANAKLDSVEAWLSRAESRPAGQPAAAPAPAPATGPTDPQTEGAPTGTNRVPEGGTTGTDASAAPKGETGAGGNETASSQKTGTGGGAESATGKAGVQDSKDATNAQKATGNSGGDKKAPRGDLKPGAGTGGQKIDATGAGPTPGQRSTSTGTGAAAPKR